MSPSGRRSGDVIFMGCFWVRHDASSLIGTGGRQSRSPLAARSFVHPGTRSKPVGTACHFRYTLAYHEILGGYMGSAYLLALCCIIMEFCVIE
ncbi:hypothetical protein TNCV_1116261 [Trichonephila clavipes]|nr:hypothetical protein TNCV_1116261 [Trichonephila clavipes]